MLAIDMFSGTGGITFGLRGIVKPVVYVEKDPDAREFLRTKHPDTKVFDDVCTFDATSYKGTVDIITGGWPCTGFSTSGNGAGFEHEASGLFTEVVRIAKECQPKYLFLENSHTLSKESNVRVIVKAFDDIGYDCRWTTCRATCVGAPHQRYRWFCLVVRRDVTEEITIPEITKFLWQNEPARQVETTTRINKLRLGFMGNAVVPDQVRYAFTLLAKGELTRVSGRHSKSSGVSTNGEVDTFSVKHPVTMPPLNIRLIPRDNEMSFMKKCESENVITSPIIKEYWATPLHSCKFASKCPRTLTKRLTHTLSAMAGFTEGGEKSWHLNSEWLAWLMGYPADYFN